MRPVCYMLVGLPGSGKSTWAGKQNLPVVSSDAWVEKLATERGKTYSEAFAEVSDQAMRLFKQELDQMIRSGVSFIWDQTNLGQGMRSSKLRALRGYSAVAHVWVVPQEELQRRCAQRADKVIPQAVLERMAMDFSLPSPDEGFEQIIIHQE